MKTIGVLSLQGDFSKHRLRIETLGARAVAVRYPEELAGLHGLILPGGESTTMGKLLVRHRLLEALNRKVAEGLAVFATCAGTILLARRIDGVDQPHLGVMDIRVRRNAYGRQLESFEADIRFPAFGPSSIRSVFIRAPVILETGPEVVVLGSFEERPILVRQNRLLAATFHPELTEDFRIHRFFVEEIVGA